MKITGYDFCFEDVFHKSIYRREMSSQDLFAGELLRSIDGKRIVSARLKFIGLPYAADGTVVYAEIEAE